MDYAKLKEELTDPLYAEMSDSDIVAYLLEKAVTRINKNTVFMTEKLLISEFPTPVAGEAFLQKMEAIGSVNPVVKRLTTWVKADAPGVDLGNAKTREMLDNFVGVAGITQDEVDIVKGLAEEKISRAEDKGILMAGESLSESDLAFARNM